VKIDRRFIEKKKVIAAIKSAQVALEFDQAESRKFMVEIYTELFERREPTRPEAAPELYAKRRNIHENPADFIKRVYAPWLGKGLVWRDLYHLDRKLYQSFNVWRGKHGMPEDLDLPTRSEVTTRLIEEMGGDVAAPNRSIRAASLGDETRDQQRVYDALRWRERPRLKSPAEAREVRSPGA